MSETRTAELDRDPIEDLLEEFLQCHRRGENVSIDEFVRRVAEAYPKHATKIRRDLPELIQMALDLECAWGGSTVKGPRLRSGQMLGDYQIVKWIGRGGMGEVYRARDSKLDRDVAIKLLLDEHTHDSQRLRLFEREARVAAQLLHPNIATVYERGSHEGTSFLVMEHVEGESLDEFLSRTRPVDVGSLLNIGTQIAQGLAVAHEHDIIHRDLKPGNVVVTPKGGVKILDFGLARILRTDALKASVLADSILPSNAILGTVGYMSPEQARGLKVDARTDLFALGVVLYEMATGRTPFQRSTHADTISAILNDQQECVTSINPDIPFELARLIEKLLAKKPDDRYQSSDAVHAELEVLRARFATERRTTSRMLLSVLAPLPLVAVAAVLVWGMGAEVPEPLPTVNLAVALRSHFARFEESVNQEEIDEEKVGAARRIVRSMKSLAWLGDAGEAGALVAEAEVQLNEAEEVLREKRSVGELVRRREWGEVFSRIRSASKRVTDEYWNGERWKGIGERLTALSIDGAAADLHRMTPSFDFEGYKILVGHLESFAPNHPDLPTFITRRDDHQTTLDLSAKFAENDAFPDADPGYLWVRLDEEARGLKLALRDLVTELEAISSEGKETALARARLATWETAEQVSRAFAEGGALDLTTEEGAFLEGHRDPVEEAEAWLDHYSTAREATGRDPEEARRRWKQLGEMPLAPRFHEARSEFLRLLDAEIEANIVLSRIVERWRKVQGPTEEELAQLAELRGREDIAELAPILETLEEAASKGESRRAQRARQIAEYESVRHALRDLDTLTRTLERFEELRREWRAEKTELDTAINHTPVPGFWSAEELEAIDSDLLFRRAEVNLLLCDYSGVLSDVERSMRGESMEGRLLTGIAHFSRKEYSEARDDFNRVKQSGDQLQRERANYWLATVRMTDTRETEEHPEGEKLGTTNLVEIDRTLALLDTGGESVSSTLVDYLKTVLWVEGGVKELVGSAQANMRFERAVEHADKVLTHVSGFTEDDMSVFIADISRPLSANTVKFERDTYHLRAEAKFWLERYRESIMDWTSALQLDPDWAWALCWRGAAKIELANRMPSNEETRNEILEEALEDLEQALRYAGNDDEVRSTSLELIESIERTHG